MALDSFRKCTNCGKLFTYIGRPMCPKCVKQMDEDFTIVRKYIYEHPNATVEEVSEETEVAVKTIVHFLREGRLEMKVADGSIKCEKCGKPINSGRMCKQCKEDIAGSLNSTLQKNAPPEQAKSELSGSKSAGDRLHVDVSRKQ